MENIRRFLESSTIHGLAYISTENKFAKVFWILAIIQGIYWSILLINEYFLIFEKETSERVPIHELTLPKVTVCPPQNTYTDLNYDLKTIENITLDHETRNELAKQAVNLLRNESIKSISDDNPVALASEQFFKNICLNMSPDKMILTLSRMLRKRFPHYITFVAHRLGIDLTTRLSLKYPKIKQILIDEVQNSSNLVMRGELKI